MVAAALSQFSLVLVQERERQRPPLHSSESTSALSASSALRIGQELVGSASLFANGKISLITLPGGVGCTKSLLGTSQPVVERRQIAKGCCVGVEKVCRL